MVKSAKSIRVYRNIHYVDYNYIQNLNQQSLYLLKTLCDIDPKRSSFNFYQGIEELNIIQNISNQLPNNSIETHQNNV